MELVTSVTLLGLAFLFGYLTFQTPKTNKPLKFFFMTLTLVMAYLTIGALYSASLSPETRLNQTIETSRYWNCSVLVEDCFGTPSVGSCSAYNNKQCLDIPGCSWNGQCTGTPSWTCPELYVYGGEEKCIETEGCTCNCTFDEEKCDSVNTTYLYNDYNKTWAYSPLQSTVSLIQWVLMFFIFYFIMFFLISVLSFMHAEVTGKRGYDEEEN